VHGGLLARMASSLPIKSTVFSEHSERPRSRNRAGAAHANAQAWPFAASAATQMCAWEGEADEGRLAVAGGGFSPAEVPRWHNFGLDRLRRRCYTVRQYISGARERAIRNSTGGKGWAG
jgi:hypothetical protein